MAVEAGTGVERPADLPGYIDICIGCGAALKVLQLKPLLYRTLFEREFAELDLKTKLQILRAQQLIRHRNSEGKDQSS